MAVSSQPKGLSEAQHPSWTMLQVLEIATTLQHCQAPRMKDFQEVIARQLQGHAPQCLYQKKDPPGSLCTSDSLTTQNHRLDEVERDVWRLGSPTTLFKPGSTR